MGLMVEGVVSVVMVIVLYRLAASHTVTHIVVRPHVELVYRTAVVLHARSLSVEQRPAVSRPRGQGETGGLVARVAWGRGQGLQTSDLSSLRPQRHSPSSPPYGGLWNKMSLRHKSVYPFYAYIGAKTSKMPLLGAFYLSFGVLLWHTPWHQHSEAQMTESRGIWSKRRGQF